MALTIRRLHPTFAGEVQALDLASVDDDRTFDALRAAMDEHAVLVFHEQSLTDEQQMAFARGLDGELHTTTARGAVEGDKRRLKAREITDISNLDERGQVLEQADGRRVQGLANRLWHTDASFTDPAGRYSMLSARGPMPSSGGETEYANMYAAYESLSDRRKAEIAELRAFHSIVYSRSLIGFDDFTSDQRAALSGAEHPLVRVNPRTGRRSLYVASHAAHIIGWPVPEGRLLLRDLLEHATAPHNVYRHTWRTGDVVIWDNRATMHRGLAFDESFQRDLRRVTTVDSDAPELTFSSRGPRGSEARP